MAGGAVLMGLAPDYRVLILGAAVFGLGNGAMDVAMNALGVSVEQARRRPVMSRLHASFSIGNLVGALLVVAFGGWSRTWHRGGRCGPARCCSSYSSLRWPASRRSHRRLGQRRGRRSRLDPGGVWLLAAMAVCFGLTEGTAIDWSSLHVTDVGDVSPSTGAWGLACVSGFMVVIRLAATPSSSGVGRVAVVRFGAVCALVGYGLTAFTSGLAVILVGWCLVGLGVGLLAPQIYGLAGHIGGARGLASWSASGTPRSSSARPSSASSPPTPTCSERCWCPS